jgi:hypothetical protein
MEDMDDRTSLSTQPHEFAMCTPQSPRLATRITSLLASIAVTALIVGSQLGIADHYTQRADAMLAAKTSQQPIAQRAASVSQRGT